MVWAFQRIISGQLYNPDKEADFQDKVYKNIDPKTAKAIIAATPLPNSFIWKISNSINCLPILFLLVIILISISLFLRIPAKYVNVSSPLPLLYYAPIILPVS